ncbi:haloacid dehalogenase type II [Christiangramia forsetii]|uniref:L-2-haloacid dehalogenase n=2 Tax=Christiangramia forsetii TaxID=411153 RepID=A0M704_CHRFK|nr:haloacid dehalogenase type II [Christiangramia forsetii]GGG29038.1 haloacid dehalogenase [Christiangramia forsetii]CAL68399.1 L-2-haloacid dehalogenase [Christiangramia forsetii KT0803]
MLKNIKTLIFDVNETLLDLDPLKTSINEALGNNQATDVWFAELLQYSLVESVTNTYHDFSEIAAAILKMNAKKYDKEFSEEEIKDILKPISQLEAYADVVEGLEKLQKTDLQLIAFSNGKPSVLKEQLEFAGLSKYFDKILSVDPVKKYKPHPETYEFVLKEAGTKKENSMMVAAHGWDITGAMRAGLRTAFIQRPGKFIFPLSQKPTIETSDILTLALELGC